MIHLLEQLTHVTGPSGFEQKIAKVVYDICQPLADSVRVYPLGNLVATIKGQISAHYQKFDDPNKIRRYQELYIDCGVLSPAEAAEIGIQIGDPISWATDIEVIGKNRVLGKALDDRAGCAVQIATLQRLAQDRQAGDVHFLFSVQEEVGLRGATVGAFDLDCDFALAIDATVVGDTLENVNDHCLTLGKGPGIKIMDSSFIAHPVVKEHLIAVAEAGQIPYQMEIFMGIGTDAGRLHMTKGGIPTGMISIPQRYAHSPIEVMDLWDIELTVDLLEAAVRALPKIAGKTFLD